MSKTADLSAAAEIPAPSRRRWKPGDDAAAASPEARRARLMEVASRSVPLDPTEAARLLGGGWTGQRLTRMRAGSRVASGSATIGALRVWPLADGKVRFTAIDGLRSSANPTGRPAPLAADQG